MLYAMCMVRPNCVVFMRGENVMRLHLNVLTCAVYINIVNLIQLKLLKSFKAIRYFI